MRAVWPAACSCTVIAIVLDQVTIAGSHYGYALGAACLFGIGGCGAVAIAWLTRRRSRLSLFLGAFLILVNLAVMVDVGLRITS